MGVLKRMHEDVAVGHGKCEAMSTWLTWGIGYIPNKAKDRK